MNVDYQVVVDREGNPKSALIDWADFQEILARLNNEGSIEKEPSRADEKEIESSSSAEGSDSPKEYTEVPTEYKEGGDYKPLAAIGVDLPKGLKRTVVPTDRPKIAKEEEPKIKLGKRIR